MTSTGPNDVELEDFRRQWQSEVSGRQQPRLGQAEDASNDTEKRTHGPPRPVVSGDSASRHDNDFEPRTYHDLPNLEANLKLDASGPRQIEQSEPVTALDHYESAVEKESLGNLGESLQLYRTAFRLDDRVHEIYKAKHFPNSGPKASLPQASQSAPKPIFTPSTIPELVLEYAGSEILPPEPETDLSPTLPCHIASLPEELLMHILYHLAAEDIAHLARVPLICRRLAFLVMTDQRLWMRQCTDKNIGFPAMLYKYICDVEGNNLVDNILDESTDALANLSMTTSDRTEAALSKVTHQLLKTHYAGSWRQMFRQRPRIRFGGCYISTVNYSRPGEVPANSLTWGSTIHIVTYYRYLRFFRDGTCISLLTPSEPLDVVHQLTMENLLNRHQVARSNLPPRVMKDALRGRWRLSGPGPGPETKSEKAKDGGAEDMLSREEAEGVLHVETEGVVPKYMWRMEFSLGSAGRGTRNNKLAWRGFWNHNRLTDDWGEFSLRNDRAFYWSRVKSYEA